MVGWRLLNSETRNARTLTLILTLVPQPDPGLPQILDKGLSVVPHCIY